MSIKVTYFEQETGLSCGATGLRMVLSYYGDRVTERELVSRLEIHRFGIFTTDLGSLAINRGYKAVVYTFHLPLLGPSNLPFETKITRTHLGRIKVRPSDKKVFQSWQKYLNKGGQLIWEPPKISRLQFWLNQKVPCLINFNTAALRRYWRNWDNGHQVIAIGIDNNRVGVLDPDPEEGKKRFKIKSEILLPAWAINAKNSSGYLLVVRPLILK